MDKGKTADPDHDGNRNEVKRAIPRSRFGLLNQQPACAVPLKNASQCCLSGHEGGPSRAQKTQIIHFFRDRAQKNAATEWREWRRHNLVADAFDVLAASGVDLDDVSNFDETRDTELGTSFHFRGFGDIGCRVALGPGGRIDHFEFDVRWRFQDDRIVVEQGDRAGHPVFEILPGIAGDLRLDFILFEGGRIHEHIIFTLAVEILDVGLLDISTFQRVATFVRSIEHGTTNQVSHFALVERISLAGFNEEHFDHDVRFAIDLNLKTFAKIACVVCCHDLAGSVSVLKMGNGWDRSMQILTTKDEIVPPGAPSGAENAADFASVSWQQAMQRAIRSASELRKRLGLPTPDAATLASEAQFPTFVSLEYLRRMEPENPADPLLRQVLPVADEMNAISGFVSDPVGDVQATVVPGMLQKYSRRTLVVATGVCGVHCRYCFRREFDYQAAESEGDAWEPAIASLRQRPDIDEVILSGGDPLTIADAKLSRLLSAIEGITHVKRLRIHTRMPIVIPQRVTDTLIDRLRRSRLATWMVVHCNHAAEIDTDVEESLGRMIDVGIPVLNQAVLLRGVNDSVEALESLCRRLVDLRVQPYYLHQLDRVAGAAHFEVPIEVGRSLIDQLRERLPGYAVPKYVIEEAGKRTKTPL
jgi:EF-P beta-lysylation protein EpmB